MVVQTSLISVEPVFGPIAGGSMLRIRGTGLDIGNDDSVMVILDRDGAAGMCPVMLAKIVVSVEHNNLQNTLSWHLCHNMQQTS